MENDVRILVVDDEPSNLIAFQALLEDMGRVVTASSGRDALRRLLEQDFAVILLDVRMPQMDGFETAAVIRERDRSRHTPIIFVTGLREEDYAHRGYYSGAVDVVYKPIVPEVLRSKVGVFVELMRKRIEIEQSNARLRETLAALERAHSELWRLNAELEERVAQRTAELRRSNQDLEQFAYVASHDLQEPLRMIAGYAQLLGRRYRGRLDADADEFIGYVVDGTKRLQTLIEDLLAYSRAGSGAQPAEPTDTGSVFQMVLENLQISIAESGATVTADSLPAVRANRLELTQVLQNLIGNALKYRGKEPPRVHVSAEPGEGGWRFSVKDNGIGIAPAYRDQIFGVFKRLHGRSEYPGNGVGLAVCKKIIERQGGRIWVESEPGQGSTFYFTLPGRARAAADAQC